MGQKLLVVDDDPAVRRLLRRVLVCDGYEVIEVGDGAEAAATVRRERPALVFLDMHMPRLDGLAALSEIREMSPMTKVIMVTGDGDERRERLALERGACAYIAKPLDLEDFRATVSSALRKA